jgi:aspartate/methionine/tyrosine aminotransferase
MTDSQKSTIINGPVLSSRGQAQAKAAELLLGFQKILRDLYNPDSNPDGVLNIAVAENTLMHEELRQYFEQKFQLNPEDFTYGDGFNGTSRLCNALSSFFNSQFNPHRPVVADHLMTGAGLLPLISEITRVIANPGDGILLAAPYYQGFDFCLTIQNGVIPVGVPVPPSDMCTMAELAYLEQGLREGNAKGITIKGVILCNPHNPLGRCYPREVIIAYLRFCETHDLHLISDEIYALSVFSSRDTPHPNPFVSALSIDLESHGVNPSRLHVAYGMSKDFNANGFRAGVLVSQSNPLLIKSLIAAAMFIFISSPADILWSALLTDTKYLSSFVKTNQLKLREAYEYMTSWLKFHNLPYIPSSSGHFLMVDLRPVLSDVDRYGPILSITPEQNMRERETVLFEFLLAQKVMVIPGAMCHTAESGWFRFTFSVRRDYVDIALTRIELALKWDRGPSGSKTPVVVDHLLADDVSGC